MIEKFIKSNIVPDHFYLSETYKILTRKMKDAVITKEGSPDFYKDNPNSHTYGNRHNLYTYDKPEDYRRTLDYLVYREARPKDKLTIEVIDAG